MEFNINSYVFINYLTGFTLPQLFVRIYGQNVIFINVLKMYN